MIIFHFQLTIHMVESTDILYIMTGINIIPHEILSYFDLDQNLPHS